MVSKWVALYSACNIVGELYRYCGVALVLPVAFGFFSVPRIGEVLVLSPQDLLSDRTALYVKVLTSWTMIQGLSPPKLLPEISWRIQNGVGLHAE